jgi:PAS domain S-box-containing protein
MENNALKILAIDDNPDNLITIKALITETYPNALVLKALNGKQGIELAAAEDPDVILLDVVMPGMDGFEICQMLKADKKLSNIPVVFVTAIKGDKDSRIHALEVGAEAFLSKPIDESELIAQIRAMMKIKSVNIQKYNEKEYLAALVAERTRELKENHTATLNLLDDLKEEIEARRKSEDALRESEEKYRIMTENSSDIIWHLDANFICDYISPADERLRGFKQEEVVGKTLWSILKPEGIELLRKINAERIENEKEGIKSSKSIYELEQICKDGSTVWTEASSTPHYNENGEIIGYHGVTRDISERKQAQEALRESEKKYRLITEKISDVVWLMDLNGKSLFVSQSVENFSGYTVDEYLNQTIYERYTPESQKSAFEAIKFEVDNFNELRNRPGDFKKMLTLDYICKDGTVKTGEVLFSPYLDDNGVLVAIHGVTRDITARRKMEEALHESEEKFREMADLLPQIVFESDSQGNLTYVNRQAYKLLGYSDSDMILDISPLDFFISEDRNKAIANIQNLISDNLPGSNEYTMVRKNGTSFPALVYTTQIVKDNKCVGIRGLIVDNTDQKLAEEKLQHIARLYALLGQTNQAIVRIRNQHELFQRICDVAVEYGKFRMAWIGILDESDNNIKPDTSAGYIDGYLDEIHIINRHEIYGKGPTGLAFLKNQLIFCNDVDNDQIMEPWREMALKRGYRSSVAVPFRLRGKVFGVLNLYTSDNGFFNEDEQLMLQKIGDDISFALDAMASEAERIKVETALENSRNELKIIYEHAPVMMCVVSEEGSILFSNYEFDAFLKVSETDFKNRRFGNVISCIGSFDNPNGCGFGKKCNQCALKLAMDTTFKTGIGHRNIEYQTVLLHNGEQSDVSLIGSTALIRGDGQRKLLLCLHDITDMKHAELALQENNLRLELAMEVANMAWWQMNLITGSVQFQRRKAEILGYSPERFTHYEDFMALVHPDDYERTMTAMKDHLKGLSEKYEVEYRILAQSGEYKWFYEIGSVVERDYDNTPVLISGLVQDVTDRKYSEQALQESEQYTSSILAAIPDQMFILDANGVYLDYIFGEDNDLNLRKDVLIGKNLYEVLPQEVAVQVKEGIDAVLNKQTPKIIEYELAENAEVCFYECKIYAFGETKTIAMVRNITERKKAAEALQKSEMFLRTFIDNTPFEIWARDVDGVGILENKHHVEHFGSILGLTASEQKSLGLKDYQLWKTNSRRISEGEIINEEIELETDNQSTPFQIIHFPIYNKGKIIGEAGFNINIYERKKIQVALKESQSLYFSFIEQLPNAVFRKDYEGRFILVNSEFCKLKGINKEDFIGHKPLEVKSSDKNVPGKKPSRNTYADIGVDVHDLILKTGKFYETEEVYPDADGSKRYMHVVRMPVVDSYGNIIGSQGIMFDITERKRVEQALNNSQEQLKQFASHLQNIREEERTDLAREIHDDLGQILIALKIDLGLIRQKVLKSIDNAWLEYFTTKFDNLFGLVDNTIKTTRRIMTGLRPEVLELLGFVEASKLYSTDFQTRYKITCNFESSITTLDIDVRKSVALYRILQEALSNVARHAKATEVTVLLNIQSDKLIMEIKDNGIGFEENFKVKADSYGLIGMKERVFLLEGELFISSKPGQGTCVKVEMPYDKQNQILK